MDNTDNVVPFDREGDDRKRIAAIETRLEKNEASWTEDSVKLAVAYAEVRKRFPSDPQFGAWLRLNDLGGRYNAHDQAALIGMGSNPALMREVLEEAASRSYQLIWLKYKDRFFANVSIVKSEPTSSPQTKDIATAAAPQEQTASSKPAVCLASAPDAYAVPVRSKLRDMIGAGMADVLHAKFRSSARMFTTAIGPKATNNHKAILGYLASRCQQPDYPAELLLEQTWTPQLLYPHLPKRLLASMPANIGTLYSKHTALVETERRFMASPAFGVTDPPLAAFNEAQAIYTSVINTRKGHAPDPAAIHRPTYGDDEGKSAVIIRGRQLWPAETGAGYRYDDLRCGCGLASDILNAFTEPSNVPVSTMTLKLRHVRSWLAGGYNSTGSTFEGMLKAFEAVIQAYTLNTSDVMRLPLPSMIKNDGDR